MWSTNLLLLLLTLLAGWKTGAPLPDLATYQLEGKLPELRDKVVLLDFWASWCGPCKASFPVMQELHTQYAGRGLVIVAVSVDEDRAAMEAFLKKHPVAFTIVRDAAQKLVAAADVQALPTSFLIDRTGKLRFMHTGFRGEVTRQQYRAEIERLLKE
jgi:thiol-disulfide isomerase/thioredoxin